MNKIVAHECNPADDLENLRPFQCLECQKIFALEKSLKRHILKAHKNQQPEKSITFQCLECQKIFASKHYLKKHKLSQHPDDPLSQHKKTRPFSQLKKTRLRPGEGDHKLTAKGHRHKKFEKLSWKFF
jgi:uncharacterized Zn-finger protein